MPMESAPWSDEDLINFQTALTGLGDNIAIIDRDHRIIFQNILCQETYGAKVGRKCHEGFRGLSTICANCPSQKVFWGEGINKSEHVVIDDNNGKQWVELIASPLTNRKGETIAAVIVKRDMTEIKKKEAEKDYLIQQLQEITGEISTLNGLLPICLFCKKVRDEHMEWTPIESFLQRYHDIEFSHAVCPDCGKKHYSGLF